MPNDKKFLHLLDLTYLKADLIQSIIDRAYQFLDQNNKIKKSNDLSAITVANLFYEPSTRTRATFELAAKFLGAQVLNLDIQHSSTKKGEALIDTIRNLQAMQCNIFILRHPSEGAASFVSKHIQPNIGLINAGDGCHAHPTQALLDAFTIQKHKGPIDQLSVAIVGDVLHSRVARSQIHMLHQLKARNIRI